MEPRRHFHHTYLASYLTAMTADWLQGPHIYVLYQTYGMTTRQINFLFVTAYVSGMIVGPFAGSLADKYGRKNNCLLFGVLYILSCLTKHFPYFWVLNAGRLFSGIGSPILHSAFESWAVSEHCGRGYDRESLATLFSRATLGSSLVAIASGVVAQIAADLFGFVAPFDLSAVVLLFMMFIIGFTWKENYGDAKALLVCNFKSAVKTIKIDQMVLCLGIIQCLFEGAMYIFVLEWTPALTSQLEEGFAQMSGSYGNAISHGYIFAAYMVAIMLGSYLFTYLIKNHYQPESFMRIILLLAALFLLIPVNNITEQPLVLLSFVGFELCVGVFLPAMSTMRGRYIPEATRSTIMTLFRAGINVIMITVLLQNLSLISSFNCCVVFLLLGVLVQHWMYRRSTQSHALPSSITNTPNMHDV